jgi:hypothetical protein
MVKMARYRTSLLTFGIAFLALAILGGCGGSRGPLNGGGADERQVDIDDKPEVERFAIEFAERVAEGDSDWVAEHCSDYSGCDYEALANCGRGAYAAEAGPHPDPQGEWFAVVRLSLCEHDEEETAPCFGLGIEREGDTWKASGFDHGPPSDSSDCSLDSEYWRY